MNTPPIAVGDSIEATEDQAYVGGVLGNDTDADGDALAAVLVSGAAHGALKLNANGSFRYVPTAGYSGSDAFVYQARDKFALSEPATVTINVAPVNDSPVAADDAFSLAEDGVLESLTSVLANDTDPEADPLTAELLAGPVNGTLTLDSSGLVLYTPAADFFGDDWFTYRAVDSAGAACEPATVTISVAPVNDAPEFDSNVEPEPESDHFVFSVAEDTRAGIDLGPLPAADADGDTLAWSITAGNEMGLFALDPDTGVLSLVGPLDFESADTYALTVAVTDGTATDEATVTINVTDVEENTPPVANPDVYNVDEDHTLDIPAAGFLTNDTDAEGAFWLIGSTNPVDGMGVRAIEC